MLCRQASNYAKLEFTFNNFQNISDRLAKCRKVSARPKKTGYSNSSK